MHPNEHYRLLREAYRSLMHAPSLDKNKPPAKDDLETLWGLNGDLRSEYADHINEAYARNHTPLTPPLVGPQTRLRRTLLKIRTELTGPRVPMIAFALLALFMIRPGDASAAGVHIEDYDTDGKPQVVSYEERRRFFAHQASFSIRDLDSNGDGRIDGAELARLNALIQDFVEAESADFFPADTGNINTDPIDLDDALEAVGQQRREAKRPLSPEELRLREEAAAREKLRNYAVNTQFYLARSGDTISFRDDPSQRKAALFAFGLNSVTGTTSGRITAAFGLTRHFTIKDDHAPSGRPYWSEFMLGGAVAVDRQFGGTAASLANTLEVRLGGEGELSGLILPRQYFTGWAYFRTDTEFARREAGALFVWEPLISRLAGIHDTSRYRIFTHLRPTYRMRYGQVFAAGTAGGGTPRYLQIGGGLAFSASFIRKNVGNDRRVATFTSSYEHYYDVLGGTGDSYKWENELEFPLTDARSGASIVASHELVKDGVTGQRRNNFLLSLGLILQP